MQARRVLVVEPHADARTEMVDRLEIHARKGVTDRERDPTGGHHGGGEHPGGRAGNRQAGRPDRLLGEACGGLAVRAWNDTKSGPLVVPVMVCAVVLG